MPDPPSPRESRPQAADDFLYHLYRGSEMLMQDRVMEAKVELEQALSQQPQDAKGQDLLAGVYFRLGVYPRAIELWERLVHAFPRDATLRVNLALVLFKTGQADEALAHIHEALRISPDHERAWGYLGLIHWRRGLLDEAREAFLRGGQAAMARRMEDAIRDTSPGALPAPELIEDELIAQSRAEMRSAAELAIEQLDEASSLAVEAARPRRPSGSWQAVEPGEEPVPRLLRAARVLPVAAPIPLSKLVDQWSLELPEDTPLAVGPGGELFASAKTEVLMRLDGLVAVRGELRTTVVSRRARGQDKEQLLGGDTPILRWHGPVSAVMQPPEDQQFFGIHLDDDVLYVREHDLMAFDERLSFESASLPLDREAVEVTQLYGIGALVLRLSAAPKALRVKEGDEVRVVPDRLVGWIGRLFPSVPTGTAPYSAAAPKLAFRGDGVVLVR